MAIETERKFLVHGDYKSFSTHSQQIAQGYLNSTPERTVRVRIKGDKGYLTVKGAGNATGVSRYEWEKEIPLHEARELLGLCEPGTIDKTRHYVPIGAHTFEVDEFHGDNEGLVVAEIELSREDESFEHPDWLGAEVTGDTRYYNASLCRHPYKSW